MNDRPAAPTTPGPPSAEMIPPEAAVPEGAAPEATALESTAPEATAPEPTAPEPTWRTEPNVFAVTVGLFAFLTGITLLVVELGHHAIAWSSTAPILLASAGTALVAIGVIGLAPTRRRRRPPSSR